MISVMHPSAETATPGVVHGGSTTTASTVLVTCLKTEDPLISTTTALRTQWTMQQHHWQWALYLLTTGNAATTGFFVCFFPQYCICLFVCYYTVITSLFRCSLKKADGQIDFYVLSMYASSFSLPPSPPHNRSSPWSVMRDWSLFPILPNSYHKEC